MSHLSDIDFIKLLEKGESSLPGIKVEHFDKCDICKVEFKTQMEAHSKLKRIHPVSAPAMLAKNVLKKLSLLENSLSTKVKNDWSLFFAIIILGLVAFWYIYSGSAKIPNTHLNDIKEYIPKVNSFEAFDFVKNQFSWFYTYSHKILYSLLGIISISGFWVLDKYLNKSASFK